VNRRFASAAWFLLGYTVLVILWGGLVRATGSGAGCGSRWPLCNGELVPHSLRVDTIIELTHRLTSGLLGLLVLGVVVAAFRIYPRGHAVRKSAIWTLFFIVTESLLGAGLVTFEWVAANDSVERVYVMAFHLVNTFLLLGAVTLTAWLASGERMLLLRGPCVAPLTLALAGVLLVGTSGAVTALGDTLLLTEGLKPDESPVLARLLATRLYHPSVAVVVALFVAWVAWRKKPHGRPLVIMLTAQLALGAANVYLRAPVWMQLAHLAVSDAIWVLLVLLAATALTRQPVAGSR